jgi:hypothetical protein
VENNLFLPQCGNPNATAVCPGDTLQVHYALANYSTEDVNVTSNVRFSTDDEWGITDRVSPTSKSYSIDAAHSQHKYYGYEVPSLPSGATVYVIVRVTATTASGVTVRDASPLRGTVSPRAVCANPSRNLHGGHGPVPDRDRGHVDLVTPGFKLVDDGAAAAGQPLGGRQHARPGDFRRAASRSMAVASSLATSP